MSTGTEAEDSGREGGAEVLTNTEVENEDELSVDVPPVIVLQWMVRLESVDQDAWVPRVRATLHYMQLTKTSATVARPHPNSVKKASSILDTTWPVRLGIVLNTTASKTKY
ncbi:uncharacterized protein H6S33_004762 [Morchella sextelata]|uniref:uncharacterized protein n=1 Tax=Morchella sextelata TaxID=1174677 RepID=UPI001D037A61|nr:uncharacterized protein H6S33_004762 [Morchella sextelata]KAH0605540.1 hypothetical protein H6S33_004762 [Morchella sextelata]